MADNEKEMKMLHEKLKKIPRAVPWENVKEKQVYHIPKIGSLDRMNIVVDEKTKDELSFRVLGDAKGTVHQLHSTSIYAKILTKPKVF